MNSQERFWASYYGDVVQKGDAWLDYSNERVQAQTFGLALEAAGPVRGQCCLDLGCGWGDFCRILSVFCPSSVTGVDLVPEVIERHARTRPDIRWICGSIHDPALDEQLGVYDRAFLLEVLQYGPLGAALDAVWRRLRPGGRLVAIVPNAACPIVSRTRARFGTHYAPPTLSDIRDVLQAWSDLGHGAYRGLFFGASQHVVPYEVSPWLSSGGWDGEPNRLQFVAIKSRTPAA